MNINSPPWNQDSISRQTQKMNNKVQDVLDTLRRMTSCRANFGCGIKDGKLTVTIPKEHNLSKAELYLVYNNMMRTKIQYDIKHMFPGKGTESKTTV